MVNVLVTGGAGYVGSHLVDEAIAADHNVGFLTSFWKMPVSRTWSLFTETSEAFDRKTLGLRHWTLP